MLGVSVSTRPVRRLSSYCHVIAVLIARVSTRVVVVVVRELFSLVTSEICVRIRG